MGQDPALQRGPDDAFNQMDWAMAKKGDSIRQSAKWYPDLTAALEGIHLALGTSGRDVEFLRGYARPHVATEEGFASAVKFQDDIGSDFKWAIVMGPEDDGLSDHEAALCQKLIRISTADESPSINIAMAAGCLLYHWHLINLGAAHLGSSTDTGAFLSQDRQVRMNHTENGRGDWATADQCEDFLDYLMDGISLTQFLKYPDQDAVRARIRRWLQSTPIPLGELLFAFEILYHFKSWGKGKFETRDFLKRSGGKKKSESV